MTKHEGRILGHRGGRTRIPESHGKSDPRQPRDDRGQEKLEAAESMDELAGLGPGRRRRVVETSLPGPAGGQPEIFIGEGKVEELRAPRRRARRRPGHLRSQPEPDPAAEPGERPRDEGHRPDPAHPGHLRPAGPLERRQAPGRARPAQLPPPAAGRAKASTSPASAAASGPAARARRSSKWTGAASRTGSRRSSARSEPSRSGGPASGGAGRKASSPSSPRRLHERRQIDALQPRSPGRTIWTSPQLFATLDPLVRRASFPDGLFYFLSDTVGFIKKLPLELVTSFKATLEEVERVRRHPSCHRPRASSRRTASARRSSEILGEDRGRRHPPARRLQQNRPAARTRRAPETERPARRTRPLRLGGDGRGTAASKPAPLFTSRTAAILCRDPERPGRRSSLARTERPSS